jgi:xylulokinase
LYQCDGSVGAAIGAGIGAGVYSNEKEAFANMKPQQLIEPKNAARYDELYLEWKTILDKHLEN